MFSEKLTKRRTTCAKIILTTAFCYYRSHQKGENTRSVAPNHDKINEKKIISEGFSVGRNSGKNLT